MESQNYRQHHINVIAGSNLNFTSIFHLELQFVGQGAAVGLDIPLRYIFKPSYARNAVYIYRCAQGLLRNNFHS